MWCRKGCQSQGWFLIDNSFTWTIFVVVAVHPRNRQCCDTLEFRSAKKQVNNSDFIITKIVVPKDITVSLEIPISIKLNQ